MSLSATSCLERTAVPGSPSILLITLDTTRADRLGCYGYSGQTSENLDLLAERGTLFTRAISPSSITPVSHASILTGQYPYSHGLRVMHGLGLNRLPESRWTLAELLRDAGYQTAAFVSAFPVTERFGLRQGFSTFDAGFLETSGGGFVSEYGIVKTNGSQRRADETTERALDWLARAEHPFFLWIHYFDPHDRRVVPPKEWLDRVTISGSVDEHIREVYDIEIRYMDHQIGRVLEALDRTGWLEAMITVVVADHGEGLGDHDWWTHGLLYEEQVRVPLIMLAPSKPAGRRVDHLVRSIDIMPTILELADLSTHEQPAMDGRSLVPLLGEDPSDPDYVAYADSLDLHTYELAPILDVKDEIYYAIIRGPWKYIHHQFRPEESELYHLERDPEESRNLAASEPELVARFVRELTALDCRPEADPTSPAEPMSPEDLERLKSLGYTR
jgi:arylsulfatase A-like enzyme